MMQIDYLILADAVAAVGGKHYIHGAGWDALLVTSFPAVHPTLGIAIRLRVPWEETNQEHTVEVDVLSDESSKSILPGPPLQGQFYIGQPPNSAPGDQMMHLALDLVNLQLEGPGTYTVVFRADGRDLATSGFRAITLPQLSE